MRVGDGCLGLQHSVRAFGQADVPQISNRPTWVVILLHVPLTLAVVWHISKLLDQHHRHSLHDAASPRPERRASMFAQEKIELEEQRIALMEEVQSYRNRITQLEDDLLFRLSNSQVGAIIFLCNATHA